MPEPAWTHPVTGEEFAELTGRERTMLDVIESLERAVDNLEDVGVRREQALREYEESESVRLARWLDADLARTATIIRTGPSFVCSLYDRPWMPPTAAGKSLVRDDAITAALDLAEAATPEGENRG